MSKPPEAEGLDVYVIYWSPDDFPNKWVLRKQTLIGGEIHISPVAHSSDSLQELRDKHVPHGLYRIPHQEGEAPAIFETWI